LAALVVERDKQAAAKSFTLSLESTETQVNYLSKRALLHLNTILSHMQPAKHQRHSANLQTKSQKSSVSRISGAPRPVSRVIGDKH
jgi:hypothetical protein